MKDILKMFSPEARADAARRVYDQEITNQNKAPDRVCRDGLCVLAALVKAQDRNAWGAMEHSSTPSSTDILEALGIDEPGYDFERADDDQPDTEGYHRLVNELDEIIGRNAAGEFATPEGVAALFAD